MNSFSRRFTMSVRVVKVLTPLDQAKFPPIPTIPEKMTVIMPANTSLQEKWREIVLGIVATDAVRASQWRPVSFKDFDELMEEFVGESFFQSVFNAMWKLAREGYVEVIRYYNHQYLVASPRFARIIG